MAAMEPYKMKNTGWSNGILLQKLKYFICSLRKRARTSRKKEGGRAAMPASSRTSIKSLNGPERARKEAGFTQPLREKYAP